VGFTFVGRDVQRYRYREMPDGTGFQFREVRDMVARGDEFLAATDMGVVSVSVGDPEPSRSLALELPTPDVYSLALDRDELWIGTARGLVHVAADGVLRREGDARPILALGTLRDTLWIATPTGLRIARRGGAGISLPPGIDRTPQLADPVVAVAFAGDTVVVATQQRIIWRGSDGRWVVERVISELGDLVALAGDQNGVWIAGSRGFAFYRFDTRAFLTYTGPGDLPGAPRDLTVHSGFLWVATDGGLVRFELDAVK
jgi:ligand-binding sensor domain-containing protein